jgi:AcrR family transcriptional regulator
VRTKTPLQSEKILTVAARLFATHRFHEARMDDIAAAAGVGKGTIYRYFKDKEELYMALLARAAEQVWQRMQEATEAECGPRERLAAIVGTIITYFDEQPHLFDVIQHAEVQGRVEVGSPWHQYRENTMALVLDTFEAGKEADLFCIRDPELAMLLLLGSLRAIVRFSHPPRQADIAERIVDGFLHGHCVCSRTRRKGKEPAV